METVKCPYCGHEQYIDHADGYGYDEGVLFTQVCACCEKEFSYHTTILLSYEVHKCDCHNGKKHKFVFRPAFPICASQMVCSICDERRDLTEKERRRFHVNTREEYFKQLQKIDRHG